MRLTTPRWSQRRLLLEFMDGLSYTTIIEFAEPLARRRGSAHLVSPECAMWDCPKCGERIEDQFDSCWKCAAVPEQADPGREPLTISFFVLALIMSVLAPGLADCIHSAFVVSRGIRFYNAPLDHLASLGFWMFLGIRAVITLVVVCIFARVRFAHMLVWGGLVMFWLSLDAQMDIAIR